MTPPPSPQRPTPADPPRDALERSHPTVLGELFELGRGDAFDWTPAEHGGLLSHQLDLPLGPIQPWASRPAPHADADTEVGDGPDAADGWEARTHRELFAAADPPLERLRVIKARAKRGINADVDANTDTEPVLRAGDGAEARTEIAGEAEGFLPREVSTVMYYAALAAARVHAGVSITQLDDAAFRTGLHWALGLAWVDEPVRGLFAAALKAATATPGQP